MIHGPIPKNSDGGELLPSPSVGPRMVFPFLALGDFNVAGQEAMVHLL